tara:strand:+ start:358 stop:966 length:609 start_codon:yes stop_codon:yes gene_type:complete
MNNQDPNISAYGLLLNDIYHPNPNINKKAYSLIQEDNKAEILSILILNLSSDDPGVRRKSIKAISSYGESVLVDISNLFLSSKDRFILTSSLKIFVNVASNFPDIKLTQPIILSVNLALDSEFPELNLIAISFLRQLGYKALPYLFKLLDHENILISSASITAVSEIKSVYALEKLKEIKDDPEKDCILRSCAENALLNYSK